VGASDWSYSVPYQPDLDAALQSLREQVFADGDYWWAAKDELGTSAKEYDDRPTTLDDLWADESVQESGTHSILDIERVVPPDEAPDYGTIQLVTAAEAIASTGHETLTRQDLDAIRGLAARRWFGRGAILHDDEGKPVEIHFWGFSGD
jgi:hypothetical protein